VLPVSYDLIETDGQLAALVARLRSSRCTRIAIDVEGENNLHSYGIHVALIQLFDGSHGYVVDVLAIRDRTNLRALLENVPWTLVWFDAANDLLSFQHALSIRPAPILDLAVAARLLGKPGGLQALTQQGGSSSVKDRFQKSNWMRRPISRAMLDYAFSDVMHLLPLADGLMAEIAVRGLQEVFRERNKEQESAERTWNPLANFTRIPGFNRLSREMRSFAQVVWYAREYYGRMRDVPPGMVASKQDMRAMIDRGILTPAGIVAFINKSRKKGLVDEREFTACFAQAEGDVAAASPRKGHDTAFQRGGSGRVTGKKDELASRGEGA
jgi:ribonuclease D